MPQLAYCKKSDWSSKYRQRFIELSMSLSRQAELEGLRIVPFHSTELKYFSVLPDYEQRHVLEQLEALNSICMHIQGQGASIRSVKNLTWAFLKHFKCTAPSNLIDCLNDDDLVNAFGKEHKLLFASFNFFEALSYSLEEIYCRPWMQLLQREEREQEQLESLSNELLEGRVQDVSSMKYIRNHEVEEAATDIRVSLWIEPQICAPLYYKSEVIGYVGAFRHRVVRSKYDNSLLSINHGFLNMPAK